MMLLLKVLVVSVSTLKQTLNKCLRASTTFFRVREGNIEPSIRLNNAIVGISALIYKHKRMSENIRYIISGIISLAIIFIIVAAVPVACFTLSVDEIYKTGEKDLELEGTDEKSNHLPQVEQKHRDVANVTTFESSGTKPDKLEQANFTINLERLPHPVPSGSSVTIHGSVSSSDKIISVKWRVQGNGSTTLTLLSVKQIQNRKGDFIPQTCVNYISSSDSSVPSITIKNVESTDEGMYSCLVSTQNRMVESNKVQLKVTDKDGPVMKTNPIPTIGGEKDLPVVLIQKTVGVKPGVRGEIPCTVKSFFMITSVTWYKHVGDGNAIIETSAEKYTCKCDPPTLFISNVETSDKGMYSCKVTNKNGTTTSDIVSLNVV